MDAHEEQGVIHDQMHVKGKQFASHKRTLFQAVSKFEAAIGLAALRWLGLCSVEAERTPVCVCVPVPSLSGSCRGVIYDHWTPTCLHCQLSIVTTDS